MYVRASFCVSKVGMIVSSSLVGVALGTADGASVWAAAATGATKRKLMNRKWHRYSQISERPIETKSALICVICRQINVFGESDALLQPIFDRSLPWMQFPPRLLCAADSRSRTCVAADSSGSGSRRGNHRECSRRCAFSSVAGDKHWQNDALRRGSTEASAKR